MIAEIQKLLDEVESTREVEILYACESGSRAWGFASPDSDYDIRFFYRSKGKTYLSLFEGADTIEIPIKDDLDPAGWDIRKALGLLAKTNAALIEWIHSPIVYRDLGGFRARWQKLAQEVLSPRHLSHHYLGLAKQVEMKKLQGDEPSAKGYLYVCRALLASRWVETKGSIPPVAFDDLLPLAEDGLRESLLELADWKSGAHETASPGRVELIDRFVEESLAPREEEVPFPQPPAESVHALLNQEFQSLTCVRPSPMRKEEFTLSRIRKPDLLLLDVLSGSHAYGTSTERSDRDFRGAFAAPESFLAGLETIEQVSDEKSDEVYYELTRFMGLLEKNNPTTLELLFSPEDCIQAKHPVMDLIDPKLFLSKRCEQSFAGFAVAQIKKARGLNKKIVNPQPEERKHLRDFCFVLEGQGSRSLSEWLSEQGIKEEDCGMVASRHAPSVYAIFHDPLAHYRGIFSRKDDAAIICSSVALEACPIAWMSCNLDAFKAHCREHREYWKWVSERNEDRYMTNSSHGRGYDSKNMMHTLRLIDMASEIATEQTLRVRRPNREWLLRVKSGEFEYDDLLKIAEDRLGEVVEAYAACDLPEEVEREGVRELLERMRFEISRT
jgi:predicted nucleotidyltransferase